MGRPTGEGETDGGGGGRRGRGRPTGEGKLSHPLVNHVTAPQQKNAEK